MSNYKSEEIKKLKDDYGIEVIVVSSSSTGDQWVYSIRANRNTNNLGTGVKKTEKTAINTAIREAKAAIKKESIKKLK